MIENEEELIKRFGSEIKNSVEAAVTKLQLSSKKGKEDKYMSRKEVCKRFNCSYSTVHRMVNRGELNCYKLGRKSLFKSMEVDNVLIKLETSNQF
jgi:excisionase family DNA binding protein